MNAVDEGQVHWTDWLHDLRTHAEQTLGARGIALAWRVAGVPPVASIESAAAVVDILGAFIEELRVCLHGCSVSDVDGLRRIELEQPS
jgi:hypothetical protein